MHMKYIELCTLEMACTVYSNVVQGSTSASGGSKDNDDTSTSGGNTLGLDHVDFSCRSVDAIKAWMDIFFSLSPAECTGLSFIHMAQLARCLMVLYRLSTFVHPDWDCQLVRSTLDILLVLDGIADKLEMASSEAGEQSPDDLFMRLSGMMRKFRTNAAAKMGQKVNAVEDNGWLSNGGAEAGGGGKVATAQNQPPWQLMSSNDDLFMDSIFRNFEGGWSV